MKKVGLPRSIEEKAWENLLSLPEGRNFEWAMSSELLIASKRSWIFLSQIQCPHRELDITGKERKPHPGSCILCCICDHHFLQKRNVTKWEKFHLPDFITIMLESSRCSIQLLLIWGLNLSLLPLLTILQLSGHGSHHPSFISRFQKHCVFHHVSLDLYACPTST